MVARISCLTALLSAVNLNVAQDFAPNMKLDLCYQVFGGTASTALSATTKIFLRKNETKVLEFASITQTFFLLSLSDLVHCTNEPNVSIPHLANLLVERSQNANWVVVYKALITTNHLLAYGNEVRIWYHRPTHNLITSNLFRRDSFSI